MNWKEYQEEAAKYFRELGLDANTNATVNGVRTSHDIDVLVKSRHAGFEVTWVVECKHWKEKVSKLHVLALREIVTEVGADRGILLSESGFQSGALEAANLTNVRLTSLVEMRRNAAHEIYSMRLVELYDKVETLKNRYWQISKNERKNVGLRPDGIEWGYSGNVVISFLQEVINKAFRGVYPIEAHADPESLPDFPAQVNSLEEFMIQVEPHLLNLERLIQVAENLKN